MYFDRFDLCTALNVLAHDWGLYDVKARLDSIGFKSSHSEEFYDGLTENAQLIYDYYDSEIRLGHTPIKSQFLPI